MNTKHIAHKLSLNTSKAVASCSCRGWSVEGFSADYARRNYNHHIAGLPDKEKETNE
jgi:hypothetical protein